MASLATFVNRFTGVRDLADVPSSVWTRTDTPRLRPLANEDVYLFVKRIDNTSVIRAIDPAAQRARGNSMATGFAAAVLVIIGLVPTAYNITAGFTLQQLRQEQAQLQVQRAKLEAAEAALISPDRLREYAKSLKMAEPEPQQVQTLDGMSRPEPSEALNKLPFSPGRYGDTITPAAH
jgi:cell division protein FtsL